MNSKLAVTLLRWTLEKVGTDFTLSLHEREEKTQYMWHERFCETNQSVKILQMSLTNTYTELKSSQLNLHPLPLTSDP